MVSSRASESRSPRSRAAASPRRRPRSAISHYSAASRSFFHSGQEGDQLAQGPDRDRRADAVPPPGLDALVGPDDRVRSDWLIQPDLRERVAGDHALVDSRVQRRTQRGADPVDGGRGDRCPFLVRWREQVEAGLKALAGEAGEGDPADAGDEVSVNVVAVAEAAGRGSTDPGVRLRESVGGTLPAIRPVIMEQPTVAASTARLTQASPANEWS